MNNYYSDEIRFPGMTEKDLKVALMLCQLTLAENMGLKFGEDYEITVEHCEDPHDDYEEVDITPYLYKT